MRFKINWACLTGGRKFTVFSLFYVVFEGNFPSTSPRGSLYLEGRFNGGFSALPVWRDLISYPDLPRPRENRVRSGYEIRREDQEGLCFGILGYFIDVICHLPSRQADDVTG